MPLYEIMFIVQPDREGDALEEAVFRVKEVIERENGEVVSLKKLGKRRLAYEIKEHREGSYILAHVHAGKEVIPVLEHFFKVNEGYLRYIVIRLDEEKQEQAGVSAAAENISAGKEAVEETTAENVQAEDVPTETVPAESAAEKETGTAEGAQSEGQDSV
ncbi:MAG: 30S ribosomal protein S6 [Dethiobacteria bacterium]|jgi:small subunit ribosomal protein S6